MLHSPLAIGNVFRRIRKRHLDKPSLRDAADVIGVTHSTLGNLENGTSHAWDRDRITVLCKFYGVTLKDFDAMCTMEDKRLDNPERSIHDPDADPDEVARYKRELAAVNPTSQAINALHFLLADELPPKIYLAELNAIALQHGISLTGDQADSAQASASEHTKIKRSFKVAHPERTDPGIKGAVVQDITHYEVDEDGQPKQLTDQPAPPSKSPNNKPPPAQTNQSG